MKPSIGLVDPEGAVIRGRVKTEEKPDTFNQLWTAEEQQRSRMLYILSNDIFFLSVLLKFNINIVMKIKLFISNFDTYSH